MISVGDEVRWHAYDRSVDGGRIEEIVGDRARVAYGPFGDEMWILLRKLWTAQPNVEAKA